MYNPDPMNPPEPGRGNRRKKAPPHLLAPSQWPTWLVIGIAWLLARLPLTMVRSLGLRLGRATYPLAHSRREIAATNLGLCFPQLTAQEQEALTRDCLQQVTLGTLELAVAWLNPGRDVRPYCTVSGAGHLRAAQSLGRGVVLVGGHYAVMDIIAQSLAELGGIDLMYRKNKQPAWEWLQMHGRGHYFEHIHERTDTRSILRALKQGRTIWYAADQDYGAKHSVFAPFYGIPAATITATARLARFNQSPVLLLSQHRRRDGVGWHLTFTPVVQNFPSGDDVVDATRMNALLEAEINKDPAQYLWVHKRFKTRPEGEAQVYNQRD
ncbi:MAG: LpxL/LpxP family Kdo(2)-lipid IV(A) lauroyl/palmitoleoyl acyltransferase [Pseudomonadales bacterium]